MWEAAPILTLLPGCTEVLFEFFTANEKVKKVTIKLPEGYVFENVPKSKRFRTDDNII